MADHPGIQPQGRINRRGFGKLVRKQARKDGTVKSAHFPRFLGTMKVHAIQTGSVRVKTAQVEGRGHGLSRRFAIFTDKNWTRWLPTYAWVIEHPEGVIVVDTGQGAHLLESGKSLHPYLRWEVAHDGGLAHFPDSEILVAAGELRTASGTLGRLRGYLPHRWPTWFDPKPLSLAAEAFGPFAASRQLTQAGDVVAVATPGHTADHISIVVQDGEINYLLAGDTSYNEELMLAGRLDGVSADEQVTSATLDKIRRFTQSRPTVYLPTHDPGCADRLANRLTAGA